MTRVIRLPDPLSSNLSHLKTSETIAISAEAKRRKAAGEDVLDLGAGEPDFDTPGPAAQAGILAIQHGYTRYPPNNGLSELRHAIAKNLSQLSGGPPRGPDGDAIQPGYPRYPPTTGLSELRHAIAKNLSQLSGGRAVDPDAIVISSGSRRGRPR